jgi:hypothetical protein
MITNYNKGFGNASLEAIDKIEEEKDDGKPNGGYN